MVIHWAITFLGRGGLFQTFNLDMCIYSLGRPRQLSRDIFFSFGSWMHNSPTAGGTCQNGVMKHHD